MKPAIPRSRFLARGLSVFATALLAVWVIEPGAAWSGAWGLALMATLPFMALDWQLLRPRHRLAERLATGSGQLLLGLVILVCVAPLFGCSPSVAWALSWLVLASIALLLLEVGSRRIAAWRPPMPRILLAGGCPHVGPFAEQLGMSAVQLSREDALGWLTDRPTRQLSDCVVIFDTCLHATSTHAVPTGCPVPPLHEAPACSAGTAAAKRLFDLLSAAVLLSGLAPLLVFVALVVRLQDGGPILFRQQRLGLHGSMITVLKFRSMRVAACSDLLAPQARDEDPRITAFGKWMRHWGIDELPQLFNVLRGDMSMVGPRPHAVAHDLYYGARVVGYAARQAAHPGITGLAQIRGRRGETRAIADMALRVSDDLEYISRQSLWLDLFILLVTPLTLLRSARGRKQTDRAATPDSPTFEPFATPSEDSRCADSKAESV
ncbi:sugar transferase [Metapseudomonas otitidis]|uniref:sugar transferase n=1 Tax=Metapseudomonas otitidis TaxID=319939 RepID=UPI001F4859F0|nr:sugar transferase [Pseudomonas otitidis]